MKATAWAWASFVVVVLGAGTISCRRATDKETTTLPSKANMITGVASVAGAEISEEMLRAEVRRRANVSSETAPSKEQTQDALERLIQQEALYAQAKASGFDQSAGMQARIKSLIIAQFREQRFTNATPAVSDREIQLAYDANRERFASPAAVRASIIFIAHPVTATAEKKAEAKQRAAAILDEARAGDEAVFARLAVRNSEDQVSRYRGGDLGWISRGALGVEPALIAALEHVETPGAFAPLVETPRGYFVAKLVEKREASHKPLTEVADVLRHQLAREKAAQAEREFYASMKAGLDIRIDRPHVENLSWPTRKTSPPAMPGVSMSRNP